MGDENSPLGAVSSNGLHIFASSPISFRFSFTVFCHVLFACLFSSVHLQEPSPQVAELVLWLVSTIRVWRSIIFMLQRHKLALQNMFIPFVPHSSRGPSNICLICLSKFHQIFCTRHMWPWLSPPLMAMQYVMYLGFYKDNICFHTMEQTGQNQRWRICFIQFARWLHRFVVCHLWLHLVDQKEDKTEKDIF